MSCSAGICTPTAKSAVLNAGDLAGMLGAGDVKIATTKHSAAIVVDASVTWTSPNRLTLDARTGVFFKATVVSAGGGGLSIVTNDGGSGGDLLFSSRGNVTFWDTASGLTVNGAIYSLVKSVKDLASAIAANPSGNFALASSYDAAQDGKYLLSPVPTTYLGSLEGLGNTISNLDIAPKDNRHHQVTALGLFADIDATGSVRDINIAHAKIVSGSTQISAGLLAAANLGTIAHAAASGSIRAYWQASGHVGGLAGFNGGTLLQSGANVAIQGPPYGFSGGLVGSNTGTVDGCTASGNGSEGGLVGDNQNVIVNSHASGAASEGGLVASNEGSIEYSFATGAVRGSLVGGLVAANQGVIAFSYATGTVTGDYQTAAGGLVAILEGGTIENAYATGSVSGGTNDEANGGLIGENEAWNGHSHVESAYAIGAVSGSPGSTGGLVGSDQDYSGGDFQSAYWDLDTTGIGNASQGSGWPANDAGIIGLTNAQLKSGLPAGFDPAIWSQSPSINNGYPYLLALPPR